MVERLREDARGKTSLSGRMLTAALLVTSLSACVTIDDISRANLAFDVAWQQRNEEILVQEGVRAYAISPDVALLAIADAMRKLEIVVETQDHARGVVIGRSNAPRPLSDVEWEQAADMERANARRVMAREIGPLTAAIADFETRGFQVLTAGVATKGATGTIVSFGFRLVRSGPTLGAYWPRHTVPHAVALGVRKAWAAFDRSLVELGVQPEQVPLVDRRGAVKHHASAAWKD